jgi:hypothetical protein
MRPKTPAATASCRIELQEPARRRTGALSKNLSAMKE